MNWIKGCVFLFSLFYVAYLFGEQRANVIDMVGIPVEYRARKEYLEDRILGSLLAAAAGDALGRPTEFLSLDGIKARFGKYIEDFHDFKENDFCIINGKKVALYTDDTAMALLVLKALIPSRQSYDLDKTMSHIASSFMIDYQINKRGWAAPFRVPGNGCLRAVQAIEHRFGMQFEPNSERWWDLGATAQGGCGSVMHAYPFGLIFCDDAERAAGWAAEHSKITHGASSAVASCAALAAGVACAIQGRSCDEIVAAMSYAARFYGKDEKTACMIEEAASLAKDNNISSVRVFEKFKGWAAHEAIAAATYIFVRYPDNVEAALHLGVNTPGDSDSIASIAGSLAGAYCGAHAIKQAKDWLDIVENGHAFIDLAHQTTTAILCRDLGSSFK